MLFYYTMRCKETTVKRSTLVLCYLELVLLSVTFAISLKIFFIKCLLNGLCQIRSFLMVTQSIFLQCVDTKRVQLIYPPLIFFTVLSFCHEWLRLLCYITDVIDKYQTERVLASASTPQSSLGTHQVIANYLFLLDRRLAE